MTNNLLRSRNLRAKFVDDTTATEIIPGNGISILNYVANDIYNFSNYHRMKLNPIKCKEMLINFMSNHNLILIYNPIIIGPVPEYAMPLWQNIAHVYVHFANKRRI